MAIENQPGSRFRASPLLLAGITLLAGGQALAGLNHHSHFNNKPYFVRGDVSVIHYDGVTDDLLTAGLGKSGLEDGAPSPGFADAENPTDAELRRLAIYSNYRALVPTEIGNGYGVFFGPNIDADGNDTGTEGLVAGTEYLAFAGNGRSGRPNVVLMVQIPDSFDPAEACIVTAPSSGSRGIYGAIGTAGEWGLRNRCAVAYTDKGTGTGAHNLGADTVTTITGQVVDADAAGADSHFTARINDKRRKAFNEATPFRYAFKHAHSRLNPESAWGHNVLQSIEFAFYALNERYGEPGSHGKKRKTLNPANTIVIASSVSNGGGASVRAAELDNRGLIDAVAVSEPNVNPRRGDFGIVQGEGEVFYDHSKSLFEYTTLLNVYQGCAGAAVENALAPFNFAPSPSACTSLFAKGLLAGSTLDSQAAEAQAIINDAGFVPEQNLVQPSHWWANVPQAIAVTYANAYGRVSVLENLCGYSFAASDAVTAEPVALPVTGEKALYGTSNGIPPTAGVNLINNDSLDGPRENRASISQSTGLADQNLDGALCLRSLAIGRNAETGARQGRSLRRLSRLIDYGIATVRADGNLRERPAVIVTGRSDAILPINHTSRAYFGLNQQREGQQSGLRYYEITNAHHLDVFNKFPGFDALYVPLHHYLFEALDLVMAKLKHGEPLPPSQVVHTLPRGAGAPPIEIANLPPIAADPGDAEIVFDGSLLQIPD